MRYHLPILFIIISLSLSAQSDPKAWTIKDIINTEYLGSPVIAPNNTMVAWTKRRAVKEKDKFVNDIYLTRLDLKKDEKYRTFKMTSGDESDFAPFFSRDSETLYFRSSRDEGKKLWSLSVYGGEAQEVHEFKNGLSNVQWLSDSTFAFVASEGKTLHQQELKKKKDNVKVVEDSVHWSPKRVFQFDVKNKKIQRLTNNEYPVATYTASKDGQWIVYRLTMSPHYAADAQPAARYYLKNLTTGAEREILKGLQSPSRFQFTPDHQGFYFIATQSSDPQWNGAGVSTIHYYDLSKYGHQQVPLDWKNESEGRYWVLKEGILVELPDGPLSQLAFYAKTQAGWSKAVLDMGEQSTHAHPITFSEDGSLVIYEYSKADRLPGYYVAKSEVDGQRLAFKDPTVLTQLNGGLQKKKTTRYEVFRWKGHGGEEVNGLLYYPEDYEEGKRYPLILSIHGGPSGVDTDRWRERWSTYPQLLTQRGAFVLKPNYHGSSHHGQAFVESIKGNYYDLEMVDIMNGIDTLDQMGMIDRDKLGTMGWSNGAILTTMLTVRYPDVFKVACAGAGDVNWTSDYGTCRFGVSFDQSYFGGAPWDDTDGKPYNETYVLKSPLFELEKVKTPTIIFHGSEDRAVPRDQGYEYYRALQQAGQTPVRFLWFPGQPHGLGKVTHQTRKMKEELAWIDEYLFGEGREEELVYQESSPLAQLLQRDSAAAHDGMWGVMAKGVLLPEVVALGEDTISVARYELTNAQYAVAEPGYSYTVGQENYPAKLTFAQAQRYVRWINQQGRGKYRLPNVEEAEAWHKKAQSIAAKENTLQHWAGHAITVDEVPALKATIKARQLQLVQAVGQFKPTKIGEALLYDLGGNLTEYTSEGKTYGYHAYQYVDSSASTEQGEAGKYTGVRLVREKG